MTSSLAPSFSGSGHWGGLQYASGAYRSLRNFQLFLLETYISVCFRRHSSNVFKVFSEIFSTTDLVITCFMLIHFKAWSNCSSKLSPNTKQVSLHHRFPTVPCCVPVIDEKYLFLVQVGIFPASRLVPIRLKSSLLFHLQSYCLYAKSLGLPSERKYLNSSLYLHSYIYLCSSIELVHIFSRAEIIHVAEVHIWKSVEVIWCITAMDLAHFSHALNAAKHVHATLYFDTISLWLWINEIFVMVLCLCVYVHITLSQKQPEKIHVLFRTDLSIDLGFGSGDVLSSKWHIQMWVQCILSNAKPM